MNGEYDLYTMSFLPIGLIFLYNFIKWSTTIPRNDVSAKIAIIGIPLDLMFFNASYISVSLAKGYKLKASLSCLFIYIVIYILFTIKAKEVVDVFIEKETLRRKSIIAFYIVSVIIVLIDTIFFQFI
jgi:hypothetical protein